MPNIQPYDPGIPPIRPSETGVEAFARAGVRAGAFYNQAGRDLATGVERAGRGIAQAGEIAENYEAHKEIAAGAATSMTMFTNLLDAKDQAIKDISPDDPLYGQKVETAVKAWRESSEQQLDQWKSGFNTSRAQEWAEQHVDQMRQHMFVQSAADITHAANIGVHNAARTALNEATNHALLHPEMADTLHDQYKHLVSGLIQSSPVKGIDAAKLQSEAEDEAGERIYKAQAIGAIQQSDNPEAVARSLAEKNPKYIDGATAALLARQARQEIRAREADFQMARRLKKQDEQDKSNEAVGQYRIDMTNQDPRTANDPIAQKIAHDPTLLKQDRANLLALRERELKPETDARISAETEIGLLKQLRGAQSDDDYKKFENAVWAARLKDPGTPGSLNKVDMNDAFKELENRKTPEGMAIAQDRDKFFALYEASIDGGMLAGQHSALGNQHLYAARAAAMREEQELQKTGNPHDLYDPDSPRFFGKKIGSYAVTQAEALDYAMQKLVGTSKLDNKGVQPVIQNGFHYLPINGKYTPVEQDEKGNWVPINAAK